MKVYIFELYAYKQLVTNIRNEVFQQRCGEANPMSQKASEFINLEDR